MTWGRRSMPLTSTAFCHLSNQLSLHFLSCALWYIPFIVSLHTFFYPSTHEHTYALLHAYASSLLIIFPYTIWYTIASNIKVSTIVCYIVSEIVQSSSTHLHNFVLCTLYLFGINVHYLWKSSQRILRLNTIPPSDFNRQVYSFLCSFVFFNVECIVSIFSHYCFLYFFKMPVSTIFDTLPICDYLMESIIDTFSMQL